MKKNWYLFIAILLTGLFITSCEDKIEDVDPPTGENLTQEIVASPGEEIKFKGTFNTDGLFSVISLKNEALLLDKEIVFATEVSKYYLDYSFTIPENIDYGNYPVKIKAESTDGSNQEFDVNVNVSSLPEANLSLNLSGNPGGEIVISGDITDAQGISSIQLNSEGISLDQNIELPDSPNSYTLNYTHSIPSDAELIVHQGNITITNLSGRSSTFPLVVNLTGEEVTYTEMYIAGGIQWWTWNAEHAYMMLPADGNPNWFEITVPAWPEEGYNEVKFLGQLDWVPDNWGLVDNTDPSQGMLNSEDSQPLLLDAASSSFYPAYFNILFNPGDLKYTVEEIDQSSFTTQPTMYIVGAGFPDYPNLDWNPEEAIPMLPNPYEYGYHMFLAEGLTFSDDVSLKFIGQNDGWGPVDVGFDENYITDIDEDTGGFQVQGPISWIPTKSGDGTADLKFVGQAGTYTVLYDHFANRALIWKE